MALTVSEIISKADSRVPNSLTAADKVSILNELQGTLFRTIYRKKTATSYDIVTGQFLYPLDFHHSKVISAIVDGRKYDYEDINNQQSQPPYLYTYENSLGLFPTPEEDVDKGLFIYHWFEPTELTESNLSATPDFDPDFHMMLVYGLCIEIAESSNDADSVVNYTSKYNGYLQEFLDSQPEPELPPIRVE
jgi:hypothetical protein